jgi:hypothetical protein
MEALKSHTLRTYREQKVENRALAMLGGGPGPSILLQGAAA